ncbi:hypothetical protein D3C71_2121090 [compost metagenome]
MALLEEQLDKAREALFAESYAGEAKARFEEVLAFIGIGAADIQEQGEALWESFSSYGEEERPFELYDLWFAVNGYRP